MNKIKKKELYIMGIVICFLLIITLTNCKRNYHKTNETESMSVIFKQELLGFAVAENQKVEFYAFGPVMNATDEDKTVQFIANSEKDVKTGFLKQSQLDVVSIEIIEGSGNVDVNSNTLYIPASEVVGVKIVFEGKYGGKGEGERHPPENVEIVIIE